LNFKTKSNLKRPEVINLLQGIEFPKAKLVGIREMKNRSIDITCTNREKVLELFEQLKGIDFIYNLSLYETENINILILWVPIPMSNEAIQHHIEQNYVKVVKVLDKRHKDGLRSAMRIVIMKKQAIEAKPLPSYLLVVDCELYVTYNGLQITCKYCGKPGQVQADCQKRIAGFLFLTNSQDKNASRTSAMANH